MRGGSNDFDGHRAASLCCVLTILLFRLELRNMIVPIQGSIKESEKKSENSILARFHAISLLSSEFLSTTLSGPETSCGRDKTVLQAKGGLNPPKSLLNSLEGSLKGSFKGELRVLTSREA